jgi:pyruvate carboxylase
VPAHDHRGPGEQFHARLRPGRRLSVGKQHRNWLDAGSAFSGAVVNPFLRPHCWSRFPPAAAGSSTPPAAWEHCPARVPRPRREDKHPVPHRLDRAPKLLSETATARFIDETPDLFALPKRRDRATKILATWAKWSSTAIRSSKTGRRRPRREPAPVPAVDRYSPIPPLALRGELSPGAQRFCQWLLRERQLFVTDTTFRDAQSVVARGLGTVRTVCLKSPTPTRSGCTNLFSLEM